MYVLRNSKPNAFAASLVKSRRLLWRCDH